jgi:hypothetical protein
MSSSSRKISALFLDGFLRSSSGISLCLFLNSYADAYLISDLAIDERPERLSCMLLSSLANQFFRFNVANDSNHYSRFTVGQTTLGNRETE